MKKFRLALEKPWFAYTFAICSAVLLYVILNNISPIKDAVSAVFSFLSPVIIGAIVAYLFNPVEDAIEKNILKKIKSDSARHTVSIFITIFLIIIILGLIIWALSSSITKSVEKITANWSSYTAKFNEFLSKVQAFLVKHKIDFDVTNLSQYTDGLWEKIYSYITVNIDSIKEALSSVGTSVSNFFVGVLFGFCFLFAEKTIIRTINKIRAAIYKQDRLERNNELLERCNRIFIRYLACTLLDAAIIGVCVLIFSLIMGFEFAPLIAIICALTNIIPTFGPWIGTAVGMVFLVIDKPLNALWFMIFCCVIQSLNGMIVKPKLFKNGLGIPAAWTLVLLIIGGKIAGMAGIILSIPAGAILTILYRETVLPKLEKRRMKINGISEERSEEAPASAEESAADETAE